MVNATVDNTIVQERLPHNGGSVTVPSGEVWRVTITLCSTEDDSSTSSFETDINGVNVISTRGNDDISIEGVVLTGGDTISAHQRNGDITDPGDNATYISGYVVDS